MRTSPPCICSSHSRPYHSKEQQQEGAEINASLHALKECLRYASSRQQVPSHVLRASALTKLLAAAFARYGKAKFAVICTASPCASDTEHTLTTLRTGATFGGQKQDQDEKQMLTVPQQVIISHPKQWTPVQVQDWLQGLQGGVFRDAAEAMPSNFTGQMLVRLTEGRFVQLCGGNERRGYQLFNQLHARIKEADESRRQR
eukprot:TRINITY_DN42749_c0_g1_i1.p1 TRINITY_DN42749_c0_g1~~TRINITY_DN42749_c0_g1_i1.p1  ORF type:complete len:201 (+),score=39.74 TRINITY_DN42749_c0_g1_i1:103-705(+)